MPTIEKQKPLARDADDVDREMWKEDVKAVATQRRKLKENVKTLYSIIWGQCSKTMIEKIKEEETFETVEEEDDAVELLSILKRISYKCQANNEITQSLFDAQKRFFNTYQQRYMSNQEWFILFTGMATALDHTSEDDFSVFESVVKEEEEDTKEETGRNMITAAQRKEAKKRAKNRFMATCFILQADRGRYGELVRGMQNAMGSDRNEYPKDVAHALRKLNHYRPKRKQNRGVEMMRFSSFSMEKKKESMV